MPGKPLIPLIFPLNKISVTDVQALQFALRPNRLLQPAFMRQRPRAYAGRLVPDTPINRPWNAASSRFGVVDIQTAIPSVVHQLLPVPPTQFKISGITRDSLGVVLGSCVVDWFNTADDVKMDSTTSDANGYYEFRTAGQPPNAYYLVAYKAGATDVAGTTRNDLTGT